MGLLVSGTFPVWGSQNFDKLARILVVTRKEIYRTSRLSLQAPRPDVDAFQCWRDTYDPILIAGGSEGAILHWDIPNGRHLQSAQLPYHYFPSPSSAPRRQCMPHPRRPRCEPRNSPLARRSANRAVRMFGPYLTFHPLGYPLVSALDDQKTRFWARRRAGDAATVSTPASPKP
jgi:hypothetical protein